MILEQLLEENLKKRRRAIAKENEPKKQFQFNQNEDAWTMWTKDLNRSKEIRSNLYKISKNPLKLLNPSDCFQRIKDNEFAKWAIQNSFLYRWMFTYQQYSENFVKINENKLITGFEDDDEDFEKEVQWGQIGYNGNDPDFILADKNAEKKESDLINSYSKSIYIYNQNNKNGFVETFPRGPFGVYEFWYNFSQFLYDNLKLRCSIIEMEFKEMFDLFCKLLITFNSILKNNSHLHLEIQDEISDKPETKRKLILLIIQELQLVQFLKFKRFC
jgi:hypothetical protein